MSPLITLKHNTIKHFYLLILVILFCFSCGPEPDVPPILGEFVPETFELRGYGQLPYNVFFPKDYNGKKEYPLIFFLHGAGERGNNNQSQLKYIAPILSSEETQIKFPAILVFPQCPVNDYWASVDRSNDNWNFSIDDRPTAAGLKAEKLLTHIIESYKVDQNKIYVSGLSMGGFGTYSILNRMPEKVTAAIAICGGIKAESASHFKDVPLQIFHGSDDKVVPVSLSRDLAKQLESLKAPFKYTEYSGMGHDIWTQVYQDPNTLEWLFSQSK